MKSKSSLGTDAKAASKLRLLLVASIAAWVFSPLLRRMVEWRIGYSSIDLFSVLPLLLVLPFGYAAIRDWSRVPHPMRIIAWIYFGGFAYALSIAIGSGNVTSGVYEWLEFMLPMAVGVWASTLGVEAMKTMRMVAATVVITGIASAVYGLFQYGKPLPWDVQWMTNVGPVLGGYPIPFHVRVFGTLNSAGPFADYMFLTIIIGLGLLHSRNVLVYIGYFACAVAMILSLVRSAWLALALAFVVYVLFSPARMRAVVAVIVITVLGAVAIALFPSLTDPSNPGYSAVVKRFTTFGDVQNDESARNRAGQVDRATKTFEDAPGGSGLGIIGTAAKLSTMNEATVVLDSGYLSRLIEMGIPGFACYIAAALLSIVSMYKAYLNGTGPLKRFGALAVSLQVALLAMDLSGDSHLGLTGQCCWLIAGLVIAASHNEQRVQQVAPRAFARQSVA